MPSFITESWLRQEFGLGHGTEIHLPAHSKLTPSAAQLLAERKIRTRYIDDEGRVYLSEGGLGSQAQSQAQAHSQTHAQRQTEQKVTRVHPLTSGNTQPANNCAVCSSHVDKKPELLTLLDDKELVPKTHPRIRLRGKLDTLIAQTVVVQTQFDPAKKYPLLHKLLADLRSYIGNILRCEVTGETLLPLGMGKFDDDVIHRISHQPLKYLGHDHILPEQGHGPNVAQLNLLRALVREVELEACSTFIDDTYKLTREDIVQGLNRLSSAFYVLMLITLVSESGITVSLEKVASL